MANSLALTHHMGSQSKNCQPNYKFKRQHNSLNPLTHQLCDQSTSAAIDIFVLILVLGACGFLILPYVKYFYHGFAELVPVPLSLTYEVISEAPVAYASGFLVILVLSLVVVWEVVGIRSRKCDNPSCRGLRKAVEFDIQIESEESLKGFPPLIRDEFLMFELREDHKELENELRKLAPPNGRAVLIFRAKCGCPIGRMQAWGSKKPRRSKKQGTISGAKKLSVKR